MTPTALIVATALAGLTAIQPLSKAPERPGGAVGSEQTPQGYHGNIRALALHNGDFRRVVYTGTRSQLVVMSIPPGGDIGTETHAHVEQSFFFVSGHGRADVNGIASNIAGGDVLIVSPGSRHNVTNTGEAPLRLYTVYSPPNHIDGRVHATKADAEADTEDEEFGRAIQ